MAVDLARKPDELRRLSLARTLGVSEKRLLGWEPTERHEHFDTDGNPAGHTIVTREPEWDDQQRHRMLALGVYEDKVCDCGFHESITADKENLIRPEPRVCTVCAGLAQYQRVLHADDEKVAERNKGAKPETPEPADGRRVFVKFLSPAEAAAAREKQREEPAGGHTPRTRRPRAR